MKVYLFGNPDIDEDHLAFKVAEELTKRHPELVSGSKGILNPASRQGGQVQNDDTIEFTIVFPNEDLPFTDNQNAVIMDTVQGISEIEIIDLSDFKQLILSPRSSVHDFDLGFQLKYLKKLGKLGKVKIVGLPQNGEINYERIQSILRKLVAQDMQGS